MQKVQTTRANLLIAAGAVASDGTRLHGDISRFSRSRPLSPRQIASRNCSPRSTRVSRSRLVFFLRAVDCLTPLGRGTSLPPSFSTDRGICRLCSPRARFILGFSTATVRDGWNLVFSGSIEPAFSERRRADGDVPRSRIDFQHVPEAARSSRCTRLPGGFRDSPNEKERERDTDESGEMEGERRAPLTSRFRFSNSAMFPHASHYDFTPRIKRESRESPPRGNLAPDEASDGGSLAIRREFQLSDKRGRHSASGPFSSRDLATRPSAAGWSSVSFPGSSAILSPRSTAIPRDDARRQRPGTRA